MKKCKNENEKIKFSEKTAENVAKNTVNESRFVIFYCHLNRRTKR